MYNGFLEIFIGILAIILSFFRKNNKGEGAGFIRKYNKQILIIGGLLMLAFGTMKFIKSP
jgi:hypothetical protein